MYKLAKIIILPVLIAMMQLPAAAMPLGASARVDVEAQPDPVLSEAITESVQQALSANTQEDFDAILTNIVEQLAGNTELPSNIIPMIKQEIMETQGASSVANMDW